MNKMMSNAVYPVITSALRLRDRLERGEATEIDAEQGQLIAMLQNDTDARHLAEYGGDGADYLGARYALVCWIDELFILYSPWSEIWNRRKLEVALYGGASERAWRFWKQADLARTRPGRDALEVFFLCVMLGFRGQLLNDASKLPSWVESVRAQIVSTADWSPPADLGVITNVAPLRGWAAVRRQALIQGGILAALLLATLVLIQLQSH